jgi:hypothetical protein
VSSYLTEDEYAALQMRIEAGDSTIAVPRGVARQFFTHVSNSSIKSITDTSMFWQKSTIWAGILFSILTLLAAAVLIINSFGNWAAVAVPLTGIFWVVLAGLTYNEGSWTSTTVILITSISAIFFMAQIYSLPAFFFILSVWSYRITYLLAESLLARLLKRSYAAFDMLVEHIEIQEPGSDSAL